jgi:3-oxoacyl-[acyl-carrier protein] reductase
MFSPTMLKGRVAVVTGGGTGIGLAVAKRLGELGARIVIGSRNSKNLESGTAELLHAGLDPLTVQVDVKNPEQVDELVERTLKHFGHIDILVNNAGITRDTLIARMSDEDWDSVLATNLSAAFHTTRAVAREMLRRRGGSIVNMTSFVGLHGNPGQTNYAATKAGLIGFTKALAKELGTRGVRVNAVAPGYITTEITAGLPEELREGLLSLTPLGRLGEPEDVARAVRFLCSDEASFVTGEVLRVDGGLGM